MLHLLLLLVLQDSICCFSFCCRCSSCCNFFCFCFCFFCFCYSRFSCFCCLHCFCCFACSTPTSSASSSAAPAAAATAISDVYCVGGTPTQASPSRKIIEIWFFSILATILLGGGTRFTLSKML